MSFSSNSIITVFIGSPPSKKKKNYHTSAYYSFLMEGSLFLEYFMVNSKLINIWKYPVGDSSAIFLPGQSIFLQALVFIPCFTVNQKASEVNYIEVR